MKTLLGRSLLTAFLSLGVPSIIVLGGTRLQDSGTSQSASATGKKAAKALPAAQEIADAKVKGMVWVNTSTRVYHKSSSSVYGTTKHGKFMTEEEAKKAGYRAAQESGSTKKVLGGK